MPSAGFPTAHGTTSSMFPSSATSGTSVFDVFRSSKKSTSQKETPQPDSASTRSSSTTASFLSIDEQKARAQALSQSEPLTFRSLATKGWNRPYPKYKLTP